MIKKFPQQKIIFEIKKIKIVYVLLEVSAPSNFTKIKYSDLLFSSNNVQNYHSESQSKKIIWINYTKLE